MIRSTILGIPLVLPTALVCVQGVTVAEFHAAARRVLDRIVGPLDSGACFGSERILMLAEKR